MRASPYLSSWVWCRVPSFSLRAPVFPSVQYYNGDAGDEGRGVARQRRSAGEPLLADPQREGSGGSGGRDARQQMRRSRAPGVRLCTLPRL